MKRLEDFLFPTQKELFNRLNKMFGKSAIARKDEYILVPGEAPVMLVAHLDTVHKSRVRDLCKTDNDNILMSPQGIGGDDRCGVYALVTAHKLSQIKPWLLFTCDEETGASGARAFCNHYDDGKLPKKLNTLKAIIEIDRRGSTDAVYYDCDNGDFEDYITSKGFKTEYGSFSDISQIAPELDVAAVNLSSGYHNAHTLHEYINRKELSVTIKKVVDIIAESVEEKFPKYEYVEAVRTYGRWSGGYFHGGYNWNDKGGWYKGGSLLDEEDEFLDYDTSHLPEEIRGAFLELLDYYTPKELEDIRADYGDIGILRLYESEYGITYNESIKWEDYYDLSSEDPTTI